MSKTNSVINYYVIILGTFLLIEGLWGLKSTLLFNALTTNTTHAIIHILLGIIALWLGISGNSRKYCIFVGLLLLVVGILFFIPGVSELLVKILNINHAVAVVNIIIGIFSLGVAMIGKSTAKDNK